MQLILTYNSCYCTHYSCPKHLEFLKSRCRRSIFEILPLSRPIIPQKVMLYAYNTSWNNIIIVSSADPEVCFCFALLQTQYMVAICTEKSYMGLFNTWGSIFSKCAAFSVRWGHAGTVFVILWPPSIILVDLLKILAHNYLVPFFMGLSEPFPALFPIFGNMLSLTPSLLHLG